MALSTYLIGRGRRLSVSKTEYVLLCSWRKRSSPFSIKIRNFSSSPFTIGILRETYDKWERRAPLGPSHVKDFLDEHPRSKVLVQPSSSRIFSNYDYQAAGATLAEDLSKADVILGVKRPRSLDILKPNKTYMFFSHVIKGQPENMGLLQDILDKKIQLIDYECILQDASSEGKPKRLVSFGKYAGMAGITDSFQALGRRLLLKSWSTPFLNCPPAILHYNLDEVKRSVTILGDRLATEGLPPDLEPLVFAMTGKGGNVQSGVREIFDLLPHEMITLHDLPKLHKESGPHYKVYGVELGVEDLYRRGEDLDLGHTFDRLDFMENPSQYISTFAEQVAPYTHLLLNCMYWDLRFPRLLTKDDMRRLYDEGNQRYFKFEFRVVQERIFLIIFSFSSLTCRSARLLVIADISCDVNGSIEFLERSTTIDSPYFQYDPISGTEVSSDIGEHGVTMLGVDILPTELPVESSNHFGNAISQLLGEFVAANTGDGIDVSRLSERLVRRR